MISHEKNSAVNNNSSRIFINIQNKLYIQSPPSFPNIMDPYLIIQTYSKWNEWTIYQCMLLSRDFSN